MSSCSLYPPILSLKFEASLLLLLLLLLLTPILTKDIFEWRRDAVTALAEPETKDIDVSQPILSG